jgi:formylglycine-generating enzyme required for sulfatase activity
VSGSATCGTVTGDYYMGKYEITNAQYAEFLNAKATSDPLLLYHADYMGSELNRGGITRSGSDGSYTYVARPGHENKPVNWLDLYNAVRFVNWLHNGQGNGDTETGAYTLLGGTPVPSNGLELARNNGALYFLPNENEWHKAAYYDPLSRNG